MSEPLNAPRVLLAPAHLFRAGPGRDAVRLRARGFGFVVSSMGLFTVRGSVDALILRRFTSPRCRALFLGLHGVSWASIGLPPVGRARVPVVHQLRTPPLPTPLSLPALEVHLTVTPPQAP